MGGAPLANETQKALCERLPRLAITQIYGQTEMGIVTFLRDWYLPAKPGACGRQVYNAWRSRWSIRKVSRWNPERSAKSSPAASVTEAEIDEFCPAQTSRFKCPKRI